MKQISQNIRRLRKEKGMSQEQLAQALHVTRADGIRLGAGNSPTKSGRSGADRPITGGGAGAAALRRGQRPEAGLPRRVFLAGIGRDPHVLCYGILGSAHPHKPGSGHFY